MTETSTDNNPTEVPLPAGSDQAQQDVAQPTDTKAEAASSAKASDELSEDDLEGVAGGVDPRIDARVPNIPID
jgi:hypothetical protein